MATVWFGYDVPRRIAANASGGRLAAPAWAAFYRNGWRERSPAEGWLPPAGLVSRRIDEETGYLAALAGEHSGSYGGWGTVPIS